MHTLNQEKFNIDTYFGDLDIVFLFRTRKVNLYRDSLLIGNGTLYGNL